MFKKELKEKREVALTLFRKCEKGKLCNIPLSAYFKRFSKKGFKSKIKIGTHKIHQFYKENGSGRLYSTIYSTIYTDAAYNFVLVRGKEPICGIAFEAGETAAPASIFVKQIQGVPGKQEELRSFRWEKILLQILIDWAKQNGFERIDVVRAKNSGWWSSFRCDRNKRLYMKYDVTAKRMGFKLGKFELDKRKKVYSLYLQK